MNASLPSLLEYFHFIKLFLLNDIMYRKTPFFTVTCNSQPEQRESQTSLMQEK